MKCSYLHATHGPSSRQKCRRSHLQRERTDTSLSVSATLVSDPPEALTGGSFSESVQVSFCFCFFVFFKHRPRQSVGKRSLMVPGKNGRELTDSAEALTLTHSRSKTQ